MDGEITTTPPVTNPPPAPAPPADPPAPRPVTVQTGQMDLTPVLNAVGSLPEKLADAVRELIPQQPAAPSTTDNKITETATPPATGGDQNTGGNTMPTKRRSFGAWFLGVK